LVVSLVGPLTFRTKIQNRDMSWKCRPCRECGVDTPWWAQNEQWT